MSTFFYQDPYPIQRDTTSYRKISSDYVRLEKYGDREVLYVDPKALEVLSQEAMTDLTTPLHHNVSQAHTANGCT
jgi:fumarate hydratase class I